MGQRRFKPSMASYKNRSLIAGAAELDRMSMGGEHSDFPQRWRVSRLKEPSYRRFSPFLPAIEAFVSVGDASWGILW